MIEARHIPQIIETHKAQGEQERLRWDKWHAWYTGDFVLTQGDLDAPAEVGADEIAMETNYPYGFIDTMAANICPPNPQITLRALDPNRRTTAKAREAFVNETLKKDKIKRKARRMVANAAICGRGISKTVWNKRTLWPSTSVIDPRFFFFDFSAENWDEVTYCFEAVALRKDEYERRVNAKVYDPEVSAKVKASAYPEWMQDRYGDRVHITKDNRSLFEWVILYEFYDLSAGRFYQFSLDAKEPLVQGELPYLYCRNPYELLTFNDDLRKLDGISDVKLIERALERLNELDSLELQHAHASIPTAQINKRAFVNPEDAKSQFSASTRPGDAAWYELKDDRRVTDAISYSNVPALNPSWDKMKDRCETNGIQFTLGLPSYSRGAYGKGELATEVALSDEATRTRNGWRIEAVHDWISSISKKTLGVWKHELEVGRDLFISPQGSSDTLRMNRAELAFPEPSNGMWPKDLDDDHYQFESVVFSPAENSRTVRLQMFQQFFAVLIGLPNIDKNVLVRELLDVLNLSEAALDPKAQQPTMAVPGQPGVPGASGAQGTPEAMAPPGTSPATESVLPVDVRTGGGASAPMPVM